MGIDLIPAANQARLVRYIPSATTIPSAGFRVVLLNRYRFKRKDPRRHCEVVPLHGTREPIIIRRILPSTALRGFAFGARRSTMRLMCGIVGMIDFQGREIDAALLDRMTRAVAHRGPDGIYTRVLQCGRSSVGLGHTRLAVIDTSERAVQPMSARAQQGGAATAALDPGSRSWLVFNGEIYNYSELRRELVASGVRFRSASDSEVLLRAYLHWGTDAFARFNGMWALAIINEQTGEGLLSRDRFGIKPLYWTCADGRLSFASEAGPLGMLAGIGREVDPTGLELYLRLSYVPHPYSMLPGANKLPPGHHLRFTTSGPEEPEPYYRLPSGEFGETQDYGECAHELRRRIERAVVDRMAADVPLGAFLSGGLDSSIVVAHLAENAPGRVKTFSIGFADQPRYDETRYARAVAQRFDTDHHEHKLTFADVLNSLPDMLDHLGEPFGDSSLLPAALLSMHTRKHVTVALSGDGGDELFAGYWRYLGHGMLTKYLKWPGWIRTGLFEPLLRALPASRSGPLSNRVRQLRKLLRAVHFPSDRPDGGALASHLAWAHILEPGLADLFEDRRRYDVGAIELQQMCRREAEVRGSAAPHGDHALAEILLTDLLIGLPGDMLAKVDAASMRHGLEVRVPMLDPIVVEYAVGLPTDFKLMGNQRKRILRDAYRGLLPDETLDRSKMGFELPIGEWLRHELRDTFHDVVTRRAIESLGPLRYETVFRAYEEHASRRADHSELLYSLLVLCWWWQRRR